MDFIKFATPNQAVSDISTVDLQNYRKKLIKIGKSPITINNRIAAVKAMYNWAAKDEIIDHSTRLRIVKKITPRKGERLTFTIDRICALLEITNIRIKALIWLGLNCGFCCTDCAELKWKNLDLKNGEVLFPGVKAGVERNLPL